MEPSEIRDYMERLAASHEAVRHGENGECHFSSLSEEAQNFYARKMRYPCVALDLGDMEFTSTGSFGCSRRAVTLLFLEHCTDTGDYPQIRGILDRTERIMRDFAARMVRDCKRGEKTMRRFNIDGAEATQVYLESAGLYGWAFGFAFTEPFSDLDCEKVFADQL